MWSLRLRIPSAVAHQRYMKSAQELGQHIWTWRCRGAAFYSTCLSACSLILWDLLTAVLIPRRGSSSSLLWSASFIVLSCLQPLMIAASAQILTASDGFALPSLLCLSTRATGAPLLCLLRVLGRFSSWNNARRSAILCAAYTVVGGGFVTVYTVKRLGREAVPSGEPHFVVAAIDMPPSFTDTIPDLPSWLTSD